MRGRYDTYLATIFRPRRASWRARGQPFRKSVINSASLTRKKENQSVRRDRETSHLSHLSFGTACFVWNISEIFSGNSVTSRGECEVPPVLETRQVLSFTKTQRYMLVDPIESDNAICNVTLLKLNTHKKYTTVNIGIVNYVFFFTFFIFVVFNF